jgi:hypothetical protein
MVAPLMRTNKIPVTEITTVTVQAHGGHASICSQECQQSNMKSRLMRGKDSKKHLRICPEQANCLSCSQLDACKPVDTPHDTTNPNRVNQ